MRYLLILALSVATPALAQDWALRADDQILNETDLSRLAGGSRLTFYDDGQSRFSAGGAYSYTYASGDSAFGKFDLHPEGRICIQFRNGFGRCDTYVRNKGRLVLLTEKGQRFPVREEAGF